MVKRNICLLVNPYANHGRALRQLKIIEKTLSQLPVNYRSIITDSIIHAQQSALAAAEAGEYVAVLGGDGSFRVVAEVLMNQAGVLVPIPAGRGNDFVRAFNYTNDPVAACHVLAYGKEKVIDLGQVNNRPFLTICSLGFDSTVNQIASRSKIIKGGYVYLFAGLLALPAWKPTEFQVTIDGKEFEYFGYSVAVANTPYYGGGMHLVPHASVQDGLLDVMIIENIPKYRMMMNALRVFKGSHVNEPGFHFMRGFHIQIEAKSQYGVYADGDLICPPPVTIKCLPKTLRILVP